MMAIKALLAFLALPGLVAFAIPVGWLQYSLHMQVVHPAGVVPLALGVAALLWCTRDFYVAGRGTLAPWTPPARLVVVGLYRYSRNPMYVAVALILLGWAVTFDSTVLYSYLVAVSIAFNLRVIYGEEPWLARRYGAAWQQYVDRVRRWI